MKRARPRRRGRARDPARALGPAAPRGLRGRAADERRGRARAARARAPSTSCSPTSRSASGPIGHGRAARREARAPETPVVMITAHGSEKIAVEAMKLGAEDYVPKPFDNDEIRARRAARARAHAARAREPPAARARRARVRLREPDRLGPGDAARVRDDPEGRRDRPHRADPRRERHRQGARRAGAPPAQRAPRPARSSR